MVRRVGDYLLGNTLGEGTFGKVKFATHSKTGAKVAIKVLDKEKILKRRMQEQIMREIAVMKKLKHTNIVELKEVLHSKRNIYMVMELCTGGELFDKIVESPLRRFDETQGRKYFQQVVCGVAYCHANGVAHRDIKPENLLLDEDGHIKISDFGLSAMLTATALETPCGTPNYVAPEVLSHHGYDGRTADVWSCGVVLYVMLAGMLPFDEPNDALLFEKIKKGQHRGYPHWFSDGVRSLLDRMLAPNPAHRITIAEIETNAWFKVGYTKIEAAPVIHDTATVATFDSVSDAAIDDDAPAESGPARAEASTGLDVFTLISMLDTLSVGAMLEQHRGTDSVKRRTCFIAAADADRVFDVAVRAVSELRANIIPNKPSLKLRVETPRCILNVQIHKLTGTNSLVEVQRRKGDVLEFHKLYESLAAKTTDACKRAL